MGAINAATLADLKSRFVGADGNRTSHWYSSGSLSPLVVSLLLVRMEPFTSSHIWLQGNRFDVGDRMFVSIEATFLGLISELTEFWELPPEFYFCPEFLENLNRFDLGVSDGQIIGDVGLSPWATTPLEFVYLHRKVLESPRVSGSLHHWIDLIWGIHHRTNYLAIPTFSQFQ
jgi:hypothetical protein